MLPPPPGCIYLRLFTTHQRVSVGDCANFSPIGILETRSFLFFYDEDDDKENKSTKSTKVQRSHSDRATTRKVYHAQKSVCKNESLKFSENNKDVPARPKCPKIDGHAATTTVHSTTAAITFTPARLCSIQYVRSFRRKRRRTTPWCRRCS